jgi:hypothetical protein
MTEDPTPGNGTPAPDPTPNPDPVPTPPEPTPPAKPPDDPAAPDGFVEQKRFTGAIQKIQTLTEELRAKDQELAAKDSQIEQTKQNLAVKEAEFTAGYGERDKQLEAALKEKQAIEDEKATLEGKMRKIDLAKELGHPELVNIIDTIPTFEDNDLQKKAMEDILSFSDQRVKAREESLLAGITPAVSPTSPSDAKPATDEAWKASIAAETDPQKRQTLFDDWFEWGQEQAKK